MLHVHIKDTSQSVSQVHRGNAVPPRSKDGSAPLGQHKYRVLARYSISLVIQVIRKRLHVVWSVGRFGSRVSRCADYARQRHRRAAASVWPRCKYSPFCVRRVSGKRHIKGDTPHPTSPQPIHVAYPCAFFYPYYTARHMLRYHVHVVEARGGGRTARRAERAEYRSRPDP